MMNMKYVLLISCLAIGVQVAWSADQAAAPVNESAAPTSDASNGFSGKVTETMNAASYTYVLVDTGANKLWAAAPAFPVKVGDTVAIGKGMPMPNYHSKTLNRDFEVVYFASGVKVNGGQQPAEGEMRELPKNHPPIPRAGAAVPKVDLSGITKAAGGKTIVEIYDGKSKLGGKQVKVRGKVVKYNSGIMGKNWLHIRDGTGAEGSNDLTVTTATDAKVGDTVLVSGPISLNEDFGAGYKYELIIEDAQVVVE